MGHPAATYMIDEFSYFSDGAIAYMTVPVEKGLTGVLNSVKWKTPAMSLSCRDAKIEIIQLSVSAGKTYAAGFSDGDLNALAYGTVYQGALPEPAAGTGIPLNLLFITGLDVAQWTDLPSSIEVQQIAAMGCYMGNCLE